MQLVLPFHTVNMNHSSKVSLKLLIAMTELKKILHTSLESQTARNLHISRSSSNRLISIKSKLRKRKEEILNLASLLLTVIRILMKIRLMLKKTIWMDFSSNLVKRDNMILNMESFSED